MKRKRRKKKKEDKKNNYFAKIYLRINQIVNYTL